jgi:hypothetical protein
MAEKIDVLKEEEKAKLNAAMDVERDVLAMKQDEELAGEKSRSWGHACYGGRWGSPGFWLIMLGLFFLLTSSGISVSWWIVPLIIFVVCWSGWSRC